MKKLVMIKVQAWNDMTFGIDELRWISSNSVITLVRKMDPGPFG
jgi:hypothetical protein